jgi:acyl-CoA reductase-like NAD-dependent aldehyde dehydrogenase
VTQPAVRSLDDWRSLADGLSIRTEAFIDGRFVPARSGATFDAVSPRDGRVLGTVAAGDADDVDTAVAAARAAFEDGRWSRMAPAQRKRCLVRWAELIESNADELALLISLEMGKPIAEALGIELRAVPRCIAWYGELADKMSDELPKVAPDSVALVTREPVGVVGAVVPWNFPLTMAAWKLGPALCAGNAVVLKPAEQSPLSALRLAELASKAGIPDGVLNVVPGFGETAGAALGLHPGVDCVTFTGSTEVAKLFLRYSSESNLKRVWVEAGGKTPNIVLADAADLDAVADMAAWAIFFNQGEMCTAGSRLLVHKDVHDALLERIVARAQAYTPGDPLDPATRMGAVVSGRQLERVLSYVEVGRTEGARLLTGGRRVREDSGGYFVEPTVFDGVDNRMTIAQEEIFGPVLSAITFSSIEEAVRIANDTMYGLAAAVWTRDLDTAHLVSRALRAGTVWVNCFEEGDMTVPFGGFKQSGFGSDKSAHAVEKFTNLKTTWIHLSRTVP